MILIFECPICGQENEQKIESLESYTDYLADDEPTTLETKCLECESFVEVEIYLEAKEQR